MLNYLSCEIEGGSSSAPALPGRAKVTRKQSTLNSQQSTIPQECNRN
ncbi:hypothetical protein IQ252_11950 [Tychonema sp. LEGE 07203]|nr:hypothetical protein [Tychonema sp. LEGE 07203]